MRFQQDILEKLTESLKNQDYTHLKQLFPNNWMLLKKKLAFSYEFCKILEDYEKPIDELLRFLKTLISVRLKINFPIKKK